MGRHSAPATPRDGGWCGPFRTSHTGVAGDHAATADHHSAVAVAERPTEPLPVVDEPVEPVEVVHRRAEFLDVRSADTDHTDAGAGPGETGGPIGRLWRHIYHDRPWILTAAGGILVAADAVVIACAITR